MNYYLLQMTGENRVWKKHFVLSYHFYYRKKEIEFVEAYKESKLTKLKLNALSQTGETILKQQFFGEKVAPYFFEVDKAFLFREDVINDSLENFSGLDTVKIKIAGNFKHSYKLLSFSNVIDCVDRKKSIKKEFDFFSTLILDKTKTSNIDGFFLSNWCNFGGYRTIVSEKLKDKLLGLKDASKFLLFDKV